MVKIDISELCQLFSYLNCFGTYSREGQFDLVVRTFGYVKITSDKQITIDSRLMKFNGSSTKFEKFITDFFKEYPNAKEELDPVFPDSFGSVLQQKILVDSDHTRDLATPLVSHRNHWLFK